MQKRRGAGHDSVFGVGETKNTQNKRNEVYTVFQKIVVNVVVSTEKYRKNGYK